MPITLSAEVEAKLYERVQSGQFASAEQVIWLGLQLIEAEERKLAALKRDMQEARDAMEAGHFITLTTDEDMDRFIEGIVRRGEEKLKQKGKEQNEE